MRHFITPIHGTITTTVSRMRRAGNVVIDPVTLALRALKAARSLLVRLTGRVPVGVRAVAMCGLQPTDADAGAARLLGHYRSSMRCLPGGWRRMKPRSGASVTRF